MHILLREQFLGGSSICILFGRNRWNFQFILILKRDKKSDILYVGATLKHAIEANFQKEMGRSVMIIEEKSIGDMPELGGMGILKATNMNEFKELCILKNYIIRQHIPCDLEIISETSIQVHPVKLFLFMTKDVEVYEQTKITARQGKRLDIESAYIDAGQVIEDDKPCEKRYIHVFSEAGFPESLKARYCGDQKI